VLVVLSPEGDLANGVGAPLVNGALSSAPGRFQVADDPSTPCPAILDATKMGFIGAAVNEPDAWACADSHQPPALSSINVQLLPGHILNSQLLARLGCNDYAMVCNYSHFAHNAASSLIVNASEAADITRSFRAQIVKDIQDPAARASTGHHCDEVTWKEYQRRVFNTLHFLQDATSEHHANGNMHCTPASWLPGLQLGNQFRFSRVAQCQKWLAATSIAVNRTISCDSELGTLFKPSLAFSTLIAGCIAQVGGACMGLERLLYHHCNLTNKTLSCTGPRSDHCNGYSEYCEGELCSGGGEDYRGLAAQASVAEIDEAFHDWASVCKEPDDPCDPNQCQTSCERSTTLLDPSLTAVGYCVNESSLDDACTLHQCRCAVDDGSGSSCGGPGQPCCKNGSGCTGGQCDPRRNFCSVACGTAGAVCCEAPGVLPCGPGLNCVTTTCGNGAIGVCSPVIDFYTIESFTAPPGVSSGTYTQTFPGTITSIHVTIESGSADEIGYVGGLLVTDVPPPCGGVGQVLAPVDVTSQVTVDGNTASVVLSAENDCCCSSGWGNAVLHWQGTVGP
jgi:hypothetical protein